MLVYLGLFHRLEEQKDQNARAPSVNASWNFGVGGTFLPWCHLTARQSCAFLPLAAGHEIFTCSRLDLPWANRHGGCGHGTVTSRDAQSSPERGRRDETSALALPPVPNLKSYCQSQQRPIFVDDRKKKNT